MKKRIIAAIFAILMIGSLISCSGKDSEETTAEKAENKAIEFVVFTEKHEKVSLRKKLGKPVVVNFWATWCPPCNSEMPAFEELYGEYGDEVEFMMINITDGQRDTVNSVKSFISQNGYTFPVYYDLELDASGKYNVQSIPTTFFIDENGVVVEQKIGAITAEQLREEIESLVGKD